MHQHFKRGQQATFACGICTRKTRDAGQSRTDWCGFCADLSGLQNTRYDGDFTAADAKARDAILSRIGERGGDMGRAKAAFPDLFKEGLD